MHLAQQCFFCCRFAISQQFIQLESVDSENHALQQAFQSKLRLSVDTIAVDVWKLRVRWIALDLAWGMTVQYMSSCHYVSKREPRLQLFSVFFVVSLSLFAYWLTVLLRMKWTGCIAVRGLDAFVWKETHFSVCSSGAIYCVSENLSLAICWGLSLCACML